MYSRDEAWKYVISKRKYLLDIVLKACRLPEMEEAGRSGPEDDEPPRKILDVCTFFFGGNISVITKIMCTLVLSI